MDFLDKIVDVLKYQKKVDAYFKYALNVTDNANWENIRDKNFYKNTYMKLYNDSKKSLSMSPHTEDILDLLTVEYNNEVDSNSNSLIFFPKKKTPNFR